MICQDLGSRGTSAPIHLSYSDLGRTFNDAEQSREAALGPAGNSAVSVCPITFAIPKYSACYIIRLRPSPYESRYVSFGGCHAKTYQVSLGTLSLAFGYAPSFQRHSRC